MLNKQKKKGVAILYLGEDLDVLMELCDRIMVIHAGAVMGTVDPRAATKEDIGALMLGLDINHTEQTAHTTTEHTATSEKAAFS
jgi:simple sugar transport system ATP-binding protein